ncbi:MAG TPA: outer membrane lipoprotein-sorting protein [Pyrinomonadaceae bacterium]|nr:outer membrane lipoprotein-sorting protein [Pyrinomonadaceae bacterium]
MKRPTRKRGTKLSAARAFPLTALVVLLLALNGCRGLEGEAGGVPAGENSADARLPSPLPAPQEVALEKVSRGEAADALALVKGYNARDVGSPGWRRVSLELIDGAEVTRAFTVVNLWDGEGESLRTLFHLEAPAGLKGTSYLLSEEASGAPAEDVRIHLFLPAGERRVLEIVPSDFDDGLLGSDFAYRDVRARLPVEGYDYRLLGQGVLAGQRVWVLETRPAARATRETTAWGSARLFLARDIPFLLGADYFGAGEPAAGAPRPLKRMRVEGFRQEDGVWTATRMVMYRGATAASVLTLKQARFHGKKIDPAALTPPALPSAAEHLKHLSVE